MFLPFQFTHEGVELWPCCKTCPNSLPPNKWLSWNLNPLMSETRLLTMFCVMSYTRELHKVFYKVEYRSRRNYSRYWKNSKKQRHKFIRKQDQDEFWNQQGTCLIWPQALKMGWLCQIRTPVPVQKMSETMMVYNEGHMVSKQWLRWQTSGLCTR